MKTLIVTPSKASIIFIILLSIPAFFINLDLIYFITDETIRALVSLEMDLKNDFIVPTLGNELYFNKPPVYNWILLPFFKLFGYNEFASRFATILFIYLFSFFIYILLKSEIGAQQSILIAFMFMVCGRIIIYDSMKGLIDTFFSMLWFINFVLIWKLFKKESYLKLFLISYTICGITFLLKGLPSVAFQGISLMVLFISFGKFKVLFHWSHFVGFFVFIAMVGFYYFRYYQLQPEALEGLLWNILKESTQKSSLEMTWEQTFLHLITFPVEFLFHFLPWTIFILFLIQSKFGNELKNNPFVRFSFLVFIFNLSVYWMSPETYPRYLFMLVPLIYIVFLHFAKIHELKNSTVFRWVKYILISIIGLLNIIPFLTLAKPVVFQTIEYAYLKFILLLILLGFTTWYFTFKQKNLILSLVALLFVVRIAFNLFVLPVREKESHHTYSKADAQRIGKIFSHSEIRLGEKQLHTASVFYISAEAHKLLLKTDTFEKGKYYLIAKNNPVLNQYNPLIIDSLETYDSEKYYLIKY